VPGGGGGLTGTVAVVTGAGAGLGRAEALALAGEGARVVVNDIGPAADETAEVVRAAGGEAVAHRGDIGDFTVAGELIGLAVESFGDLHTLVNNAGIIRDRMVFGMSEQEWDDVLRVHLKGHFAMTRHATAWWRQRAKDTGAPVRASIVNTASEASLLGSPGQPNYAAAKGGITALTVSTAAACGRFGVRANAICPRARTAMTVGVFGDDWDGEGLDPLSVDHVAPFVAFLAGPAADRVSGQVFVLHGGKVALLAAPRIEKRFDAAGERWSVAELGERVGGWFAGRESTATFAATDVLSLG